MAKTPDTAAQGTALQRAENAVLRAMIGGLMALPFERRCAAMGQLMRRAIGPLAGYRRRAEANLAHIYPHMPATARRDIALAALDNAGRTVIENYSWREFGARLAATDPTGPGLAPLDEAARQGRPVLFVTGHFGNHEAPRQVLTRMGHSIGGLYRPMKNPYFNAHYSQTMADMSGPVFAQGRQGTLGFARHLKRGGMATLLFDVYDPSGMEFPFLGRPALTSPTAAELALRFDALLIPYYGIRRGSGFDIHIEAPVPHSDAGTMTRAISASLEARITADPGQWFWVHRRWKPFFGHPKAGA